MATAAQTKQTLQDLINALNEATMRELAAGAISGALQGGIPLPPIRRDAQGVDHPELADEAELVEWAEDGIEVCDGFPEPGGG